jgi:hypothetical protein
MACLVSLFIFGVVFAEILRFEVSLRRVEGLFVLRDGGLAQVLFSAAKARDAVPRHLLLRGGFSRVEPAARM